METILTLPCNFLLHQLIMIILCFSLILKGATKVKGTNHEMIPCSKLTAENINFIELFSQCYLQQQSPTFLHLNIQLQHIRLFQ